MWIIQHAKDLTWLHNRMSYLDIFLLILVRVKGTVSIVRKPRPPSTWPLPPALPGALQGISRPAEGHSPSNVLRSAPRPPLSWACPKHLPSTLTSWPMAREKTNCCSCVCLWYWLFGRDPKLISIRQSQNADRLVNWELCLQSPRYLNSFTMEFLPDLEWAIHTFLAEH